MNNGQGERFKALLKAAAAVVLSAVVFQSRTAYSLRIPKLAKTIAPHAIE